MTHPSVNSIVERLVAALKFHGRYASESQDDCAIRKNSEREQAATIISELQAERDDLRSRIKRLSDALLTVRPLGGSELFVRWGDAFHADPDYCKGLIEHLHLTKHEALKAQVREQKRADAAESSLSRIKEQTIEATKAFLAAWNSLPVGRYSPDQIQRWLASEEMKAGVSAIRSLDKNCSGKTAESGHSAPTRERE